MNIHYLQKFRYLANAYVYARLSEDGNYYEIVCDDYRITNQYSPMYFTYGCCPIDKHMDGKGHFASYKIYNIDTYYCDDPKQYNLLIQRLTEARRVYILIWVMKYRMVRKRKEHYKRLQKINICTRIEI